MRTYSMSESVEGVGNCFLIYGETGCGKTSGLGTLPGPIAIISTEPRDPRRTLQGNEAIKGKKIDFYEPENFDEAMVLLREFDEKAQAKDLVYKSLAFDSLSFEQSRFKINLEDSRFEKETELSSEIKKKRHETLVDRFRIEQGDWGSLGSMMKRMTYLLNVISRYGVNVVATSTMVEYPRWNKDLSAAPAFMGNDFGSVFHGFFDFIGFVQKSKGGDPYPPTISFISNRDFMAKSSSIALNRKIVESGKNPKLDFTKILSVIEGK